MNKLEKLVERIANYNGKAERAWLDLVMYVKDSETYRTELQKALAIYLYPKSPLSSNSEANIIIKAANHPEELQQTIDGKLTVRRFREEVRHRKQAE